MKLPSNFSQLWTKYGNYHALRYNHTINKFEAVFWIDIKDKSITHQYDTFADAVKALDNYIEGYTRIFPTKILCRWKGIIEVVGYNEMEVITSTGERLPKENIKRIHILDEAVQRDYDIKQRLEKEYLDSQKATERAFRNLCDFQIKDEISIDTFISSLIQISKLIS